MKRLVKSRLLALCIVVIILAAAAGCGTILYPERAYEAHSDRIDAGVLVMDCAWLFVGIIPGAVALIVDFSNGSVYLPHYY